MNYFELAQQLNEYLLDKISVVSNMMVFMRFNAEIGLLDQ